MLTSELSYQLESNFIYQKIMLLEEKNKFVFK